MSGFYAAYGAVRRLNNWCLALSCVLIVLMTLLTLWEVITRYFFRQPAMWTYPVTSYLLLYSIYLALAYALQRGAHVSVDFVLEMVPPAARRWLERLGHVLGLAFTVIFLVQTWRLFTRHAASGARDISTLSIPLAPMSFVLPLGVALLAITYVFVLADSFLQPPGDPTLQDRERARAGPLLELE